MIGNDGQTAESGSRGSYEAAVLDFLNREMDAAHLTQKGRNQADDLETLVSDLLKQVIIESDQPQPAGKAGLASFETAAPAHDSHETAPCQNSEPAAASRTRPDPFQAPEQRFAEFMPRPEEAPAQKTGAVSVESRPQFNPFEDREDPIVEYMRLEEAGAFENADADSVPDASNFEGMDAVLAEYMPPEQPAPAAAVPSTPNDATPESGRVAEEAMARSAGEQEPEEARRLESACIASSAGQTLRLTEKENVPSAERQSPEAAKLSQEQAPPDAIAGADDASVIARPAREIPKRRPAPAHPVFAVPVVHRSKTYRIAAACFCVLIGIALPSYFHSGKETKSAESQAADAAPLGPKGEIPAVPVLQISPRYPEAALRNRESASVTLELSIDSEGNVVKAAAVSGPALFHEEAIRAAMKWRYKPASLAGVPIASKSRVHLNFILKK